MLSRLVFKNIKKTLNDYGVYFFTLVFGVCIFYMFNSIYAQQKILKSNFLLNEDINVISNVLSYISVFVSLILGFLIVYANGFFMKRRKKELGIYMILGMDKRDISKILIIETVIIGICALLAGIIIGVFISQFMTVFTANLFESELIDYKFVFAPQAIFKSIIYFSIIFSIVVLFNNILINKVKLIELIYDFKKNEYIKSKNIVFSYLVFISSIIFLGIAYYILTNFSISYYLVMWDGVIEINNSFFVAIFLIFLGTIMFFISFSNVFVHLFKFNKKLYFNNLNIFIMRQLYNHINKNLISITMVSITLLLGIWVFSSGYSLQDTIVKDMRSADYDFSLYNYYDKGSGIKPIYNNLPYEIKSYEGIKNYYEYNTYITYGNGSKLKDYELQIDYLNAKIKDLNLKFIKLSDYNKIRALNGISDYELQSDNYLMVYNKNVELLLAKQFKETNKNIDIGENSLKPVGIQKISLDNFGIGLVFVVDDKLVEGLKLNSVVLNIQCKDEASSLALSGKFDNYSKNKEPSQLAYFYKIGKIEIYQESILIKALISFVAIYLGLIFMVTGSAIISIQQLSEIAYNRQRYIILKKMGVDKTQINKILFSEILLYFLIPLLVSMIHSVFGIVLVNDILDMFGDLNFINTLIGTSIFVVSIYSFYFMLTYRLSKNILK